MKKADPQREEELFDVARGLTDPTARRSFLDRTCVGNPLLRQRVEGLLTAAAEAEAFFAEGSSARDFCTGTLDLGPIVRGADQTSAPDLMGDEPVGTRIGRYKLVQKIGEGGCGVVYLAEQEEPVRRRVALKIIKLGMETKSVIARFEAERQALAMMDHPNIARVFDAGATERGRPYFVMELVRGIKITEYCDQNELDVPARLDLFIRVCHAIQHAHQKGIIHGDIKPSNIMVTLHDGTPLPKVIDFGISKATEGRLSDKLLFTAYAQLIGTPAYMSPEQTEMMGRDIDTRSDIYSMGVLLYELLTGKTPFDAKRLVAAGIDEFRRTLREVEPPRPSAKLATLEPAELVKSGKARRTDPSRLADLLRGDLDWVVMKALEKDRGRRYETANGLAMEIQRHLNNEPVMARPPSRMYRFGKLVRRNRGVFAAGGAVAAVLVIGMSTSTWLFLKEREARQRAVAAEQQQMRLRHQAELREKVTQAALLVNQERFDEADNLVRDVAFSQPSVESAVVLRALGEWHALQGRWRPSFQRFGTLLQIDQLEGIDAATLDFLRVGPVVIELGDTSEYERFRDAAISRIAGMNSPYADRIVKVSLLLPAGQRTITALAPLAASAVKSFNDAQAADDGFSAAWRAMSLALWEYRRGNLEQAAEWGRRCLAYRDFNNPPRDATVRAILAMVAHRLDQSDEAHAELDRGRAMVNAKFKNRLDRGSPPQGFWFDWLFARILLREATALIETSVRP